MPGRPRYSLVSMSSSLMRSSPRTLSLLAPASLLVLASCSGFTSLTTEESARLRVFDHYWQALSDQYPLFGRKQVRWPEIGRQYRAAVPFAKRPSEFYHLLAGLLSELGDIHVSLRVPSELLMENSIAVTSTGDGEDPGSKPIPSCLGACSPFKLLPLSFPPDHVWLHGEIRSATPSDARPSRLLLPHQALLRCIENLT